MTKKIALGMSGGVDSSLCAHLLKERGYKVTGVYLECWNQPGCPADADRQDALKIAMKLNIPFQVLDFTKEYQGKVIDDFFNQYQKGNTPNPDVLCNQFIKFGLFYDWAIKNSFDAVATGHYAKVAEMNGEHKLAVPTDKHKDQTYFLYRLEGKQLPQIIFPLSQMTKEKVREEAAKRGLHVADKKDSVGVCFIGNVNVGQMLKERLGENPGEVVDTDGNIIGRHRGLWFYTIGQRSGFSIDQTSLVKTNDGKTINKQNIPPFYVIKKQTKSNRLVVGFGVETLRNNFAVKDLHWINQEPSTKECQNILVRIRHTGDLLPAVIEVDKQTATVKLEDGIKGIAPGQSAVFYLKKGRATICLGGGLIKN